jgi:glyceraldehyde-3-phosphate dehydrogenase/erythrose-4-phosphate dehydrogenase
MKITINGKIGKEALKSILETQKEKTMVISDFCKKEKLQSFHYKDAELEYEYSHETKETKPKAKEVEVRDGKNKGN